MLIGVVLCAALFLFVGCPDGSGPSGGGGGGDGGGTTDDTTSPVIALIGSNPLFLEVGDIFTDPGATATDNDPAYEERMAAAVITDNSDPANTPLGTIDTAAIGAYTIAYSALADASGNDADPVTRMVSVVLDGDAPPVITLTGGNEAITVELGSGAFVDPGATVRDNDLTYMETVIPTITGAGTTIDTDIAGTYIITYTAPNDADDNPTVAVIRTVTVVDTTAPVITLTGAATIEVEDGATIADPGATVRDNDRTYMGTVIATTTDSGITVTGTTISGTAIGTYTIAYNAMADAAGLTPVTVTRTVQVLEPMLDRDNDNLIDIDSIDDLDAIRHSLAGNQMQCGTDGTALCMGYELRQNLDFANPAHYDSGMVNDAWRPTDSSGIATSPALATNPGWDPIGEFGDLFAFSAHFNGNGNTISNLYVRRNGFVGLFGVSIGTLDGIGIVDARLYGGGGNDIIGGLVGQSGGFSALGFLPGTVINSYATGGSANGGGGNDEVGGLLGENSNGSIVTASYATEGSINGGAGSDTIGGLIGESKNGSTITASYATGGSTNGEAGRDEVGGLIGENDGGTVTDSYATGDAIGGAGSQNDVGGLIGNNTSMAAFNFTVAANYATGDVIGGTGNQNNVGGLIGRNSSSATVTASYATGNASGGLGGESFIGGLIGSNNNGTVTASYSTGDVDDGGGTESDTIGGLLGANSGTVTASYATGDVDGEGVNTVGGLIANNVGPVTASYGFGMVTGTVFIDPRSADATDSSTDTPPGTVDDACDITPENSSATGTDWVAAQWDFGTATERPVVLHNGNQVPGQTPRTCS